MTGKIKPRGSSLLKAEAVTGYFFIAPQMLFFIVFMFFPVIEGIRLSLYRSSFMGETFVGLENYLALFADEVFVNSIFNTAKFVGIVTFLTVLSAFLISASVFDKHPRYVSFIRACYYLPAIIGMTILSLIWVWVINPSYGVINYYLVQAGMPQTNFLGSGATAWPVLYLMSWGLNLGQAVILYLAAMSGISMEVIEASDIDGASRLQKICYIIWPLVRPITVYLIITTMIAVMRAFVIIYLMTGGGPNYATVTMMFLSYLNAFKFGNFGAGSAIGVMMFIVVWILSMLVLVASGRDKGES